MADISNEAVKIAIVDLEQNLVQYGRDYEDAQRANDAYSAANALRMYNSVNVELQNLTGANQPEQPGLTAAQEQFIANRARLGDDLRAPNRSQDVMAAHIGAVRAGWPIDSPGYFAAVAGHLDHAGDGRQPVLDQRSAAQISGISDAEYAAGAARLAALKCNGHYQD